MFRYFWMYQTELPPGVGTANFSPLHFAWLLIDLLVVIFAVIWYRHQTALRRRRLMQVLALVLLVIEPARWLWAALIGHYSATEMLPLHLCGVTMYVEIAAVFSNRRFLKEFSYACGMPGALAALLTPDWGAYPLLSFQYLQSITTHSLLILIPVFWIWGEGFRPDIRQLPRCFGLLAGLAGIAALVNQLLGSNYMFLRFAPPDTPLEIFETWCGNPGYLLPLLGLILLIWLVFYLPWLWLARRPVRAA